MDPYFQYFSSNSSALTITKISDYCNQELYNTIRPHSNIHIVPSLRDIMAS
jgi:hypothetical protein